VSRRDRRQTIQPGPVSPAPRPVLDLPPVAAPAEPPLDAPEMPLAGDPVAATSEAPSPVEASLPEPPARFRARVLISAGGGEIYPPGEEVPARRAREFLATGFVLGREIVDG